MTLMMMDGHDSQPLSRGLSGIFRRKSSKGGAGHVFEADGDALDAFSAPAAHGGQLVAAVRPPSRSGRGWGGILARKNSSAGGDAAADAGAAYQAVAAAEAELASLRAQCAAQERQLAGMGGQLAAAQAAERAAVERLNLQAFKYNLLVDLWAVRVLDNEELGAQQPQLPA